MTTRASPLPRPQTPPLSSLPTAFDPATCLRRGLCPVTALRPQGSAILESHSLYYEQHAPPGVTEETARFKVVFIMGLNSSSFAWLTQVKYFTRPVEPDSGSPGPATILLFDNRGVGNSGYPRGPYTTSGMAEDAICLFDHIGWTAKREIHIVGISLGGMIAQEIAARIPDRIASLVLAVTTPGGHIWQNFPPMSGMRSLTRLLFTADPVQKVPLVLKMLYPAKWLDAPSDTDPSRTNRQIQTEVYLTRVAITKPQLFLGQISQMSSGLTHHFSAARLAEIAKRVPKISIVTGNEDNLMDPRNSRRLMEGMRGIGGAGGSEESANGNVELVEWKDTGHGINGQRAEWFNALLERTWLEGEERAREDERRTR